MGIEAVQSEISVFPSLLETLPSEYRTSFDRLLRIAIFSQSDSERYHAEKILYELSDGAIKRIFFGDNSVFVNFQYTDRFRKKHERTMHFMDLGSFSGKLYQIDYG